MGEVWTRTLCYSAFGELDSYVHKSSVVKWWLLKHELLSHMFSTTALSRFTSIIICLSRPPITDSVCPERALKREIGKTIAFP